MKNLHQNRPEWEGFRPPPVRPRQLSYGHESFPIDPERLQTSRRALAELAQGYHDAEGPYPWRLLFHPGTGLPAFVRLRLHHPLADNDAALDNAAALLRGQWEQSYIGFTAALFGAGDEFDRSFGEEGEVIVLPGGGELGKPAMRHFAWTQRFAGLPVVGGSLRLHEGVRDTRVAITSSFFPVADAPPAGQSWEPWALELRIRQAMLAQADDQKRTASLWELLRAWLQSPLAGDWEILATLLGTEPAGPEAISAFLVGLMADQADADRVRWLLETLRRDSMAPVDLIPAWPDKAIDLKPLPIRGSELAVLPFDGEYHQIRRYQVHLPDEDLWYADVDVHSGEVLGGLWQAAVAAPYFRTAGEALAGVPGGDDSDLDADDRDDLARFLAHADNLFAPEATPAQRTAAVHGLAAYRYLLAQGTPPERLQGYTRPDGTRVRPGLQVTMSSSQTTHFRWDTHPKTIRLQTGNTSAENKPIVAPANDPEVVLHEFCHAFLWLLDPEPWDLPATINPIGRALQEGYAFYLARSLAAQTDVSEAEQPWARGAYRASAWGDRWVLGRSGTQPGADFLPAPNVYPAGLFQPTPNDRVPLYYDVGMVWARALWDLRQMVGAPHTDSLILRAYPYLHGYIAGFELAAEALIEVDRQEQGQIDLGDGTLPIWAQRGIGAGQGIVAFAETDGVLLAGSDAGILRQNGNGWQLETGNRADGNTLRGIVALAADGTAFYAAAHLPKPATGGGREWTPGIYRRPGNGGVWQALGDWATQTGNATPLALWPLGGGELLVASTRGVFRHTGAAGGSWQIHGGSTGMAMHSLVAASWGRRGCDATELFAQTGGGNWLPEPSRTQTGAFGGATTERLLRLAVVNDRVFVATLSGLYELRANGSTVKVGGINGPVLALAGRGATLYAATNTGLFRLEVGPGNAVLPAAQPLPGLTAALIIALHAAAEGTLWAGTQAHGIWRLHNGIWSQAYTPPAPPLPHLPPGCRALLRLHQPQAKAQTAITVTGSGAVQIVAVGQPGLPLRRVEPDNAGRYNLQPGDVLVLVAGGNQAVSITAIEHDANLDIRIQTEAGP